MAKAKIARQSTYIDMTPMVDMAFLLVTFFMLTVKFRPSESVQVETPSSIAQDQVPQKDILIVTIAKPSDEFPRGRVFLSVDGQNTRTAMLDRVASRYDINFTQEERDAFRLQADVGVPVEALKQWLAMDAENRKANAVGIPVDSNSNQLGSWIEFARLSNRALRIAIKGDQEAPAPLVKAVFETLRDKNINRFNIVTSSEAAEGEEEGEGGEE